MKTFFMILLMIFSMNLISCNQKQEAKTVDTSEESQTSRRVDDSSIRQPQHLISLEKVKEQIDKYKNAHPGVTGNEYALRTWISIEELESYIAYVKQEAKNKNILVNGIDFIHAQSKSASPNLPNAGNKDYDLTLLLAPTFKDGSKNIAFDPKYSKDGSPYPLSQLLNNLGNEEVMRGFSDQILTESDVNSTTTNKPVHASSVDNRFNSCPNNCDPN